MKKLIKNKKGFTLIEVLVGLLLLSMLGGSLMLLLNKQFIYFHKMSENETLISEVISNAEIKNHINTEVNDFDIKIKIGEMMYTEKISNYVYTDSKGKYNLSTIEVR